jgi:hypothetical protein
MILAKNLLRLRSAAEETMGAEAMFLIMAHVCGGRD